MAETLARKGIENAKPIAKALAASSPPATRRTFRLMGARFLQLPDRRGRARLARRAEGRRHDTAPTGAAPDELRALPDRARLPRAAARLGSHRAGKDDRALHRDDPGGRSALAAGTRAAAGSRPSTRSCPRRRRPRRARGSRGKQQGRTVEIQRLIGRDPARGRRLPRARRAHDVARLRRAAGRRRHALRGDLRRLRRRHARARALRALEGASSTRSPPSPSASWTASRCSTSTTPRTRTPRRT